jgi:hypothetical protein
MMFARFVDAMSSLLGYAWLAWLKTHTNSNTTNHKVLEKEEILQLILNALDSASQINLQEYVESLTRP